MSFDNRNEDMPRGRHSRPSSGAGHNGSGGPGMPGGGASQGGRARHAGGGARPAQPRGPQAAGQGAQGWQRPNSGARGVQRPQGHPQGRGPVDPRQQQQRQQRQQRPQGAPQNRGQRPGQRPQGAVPGARRQPARGPQDPRQQQAQQRRAQQQRPQQGQGAPRRRSQAGAAAAGGAAGAAPGATRQFTPSGAPGQRAQRPQQRGAVDPRQQQAQQQRQRMQQRMQQQRMQQQAQQRAAYGTAAFGAGQGGTRDPYGRGGQQYHEHDRKRKRTRRIVIGVVSCLLVACIAFVGALGFSALQLKNQASATMATGKALIKAANANDSAAIVSSAQKIQTQVKDMKNEVDSPLWTAAGFIPVVGQDISAVQTSIKVADDLSGEVLMPIADTLTDYPLNTLYKNGNINGPALTRFCDILANSADVIKRSSAAMDTVGETHIQQVTDVVDTLKTGLGTAADFLSDNGEAIRLVPDLVGCNGTRNYLVVAQNYSEARPTGGLPGTLIPLTVTDGNLDFGENFAMAQARDSGVGVSITDEELNLFSGKLGSSSTDMNSTPDWPRAAQIISQMWEQYTGRHVQGVIGIDVQTFQDLIALGSDSIPLPTGSSIQTSQLTKTLLNDAYMMFPNGNEQDAYFAMVMASAMDVLQDKLPDVNLTKLGQTVQNAVDENRLLVWMEKEDEEALCEDLGCAGGLGHDPADPQVGLYFYDETWSKIDWYLNANATVSNPVKNADGTTSYTFTATIKNNLTYDIAQNAPNSVTGVNFDNKRDVTDMLTKVYLYAPAGGSISNLEISGDESFTMNQATHDGLSVYFGQLNLLAQESETITCTVTVSAQAEEPLEVRMMKMANPEYNQTN